MVNFTRVFIIMVLSGLTLSVNAALIASVNQQRISEGDTLTLSLSAINNSSDQTPDLAPLTRDFVVLSQNHSQNISFTNGKRSSSNTWQLSLLAKSIGELTIPSLQLGQDRSRPIAITVKPAAKNQTVPSADSVLIESVLSRSRVYLGGQTLLTVKIIHRGNLINASLTEPQADKATLEQTHEASYQGTIEGTPVVIIERVYAVFPEATGTITISGQTLQAELAMGSQRSVFGYTNTKTTRRNSQARTFTALALPKFATGKDTVTADALQFKQQWSQSLDNLKVGDSVTRTLTATATGATGAQIPPIFLSDINGIKIYGDQPELKDTKNQLGIIGIRTESTAYVLTHAGTFEVPAVVLHWVNAQTGKVQSVSVPSTQLKVSPVVTLTETLATAAVTQPTQGMPAVSSMAVTTGIAQNPLWLYVSIVLFTLWVITIGIALRLKYKAKPVTIKEPATAPSKLFKLLILKAKTNDAVTALQLFNQWGHNLDPSLSSNIQICAYLNDEEITKSIQRAERSLYQAADNAAWNGATLVSHLQQWQKHQTNGVNQNLAPLY